MLSCRISSMQAFKNYAEELVTIQEATAWENQPLRPRKSPSGQGYSCLIQFLKSVIFTRLCLVLDHL